MFTVRLILTVAAGLVVVCAAAGCRGQCDASNCSGCCSNDICYLGGCGTGGGTAVDCDRYSCVGRTCCATNTEGDALACVSGRCTTTCKTSGSCASSNECCRQPNYEFGYRCDLSRNECRLCSNSGSCSPSIPNDCCPGKTCSSKPATPNYKECL